MSYVIVQHQLGNLSVEALGRAFQQVPCLTAADAPILARDAFGILVENLDYDSAQQVAAALNREGIACSALAAENMPTLPPAFRTRQLTWNDTGIRVTDPIGREQLIHWEYLAVLAAGEVASVKFKRVEKRVVSRSGPRGASGIPQRTIRKEVGHKQESVNERILQLLFTVSPYRVTMEAEDFMFVALQARATPVAEENYRLFLQDLLQAAPEHVALNGGANGYRTNGELFQYLTMHAFEEELQWILWAGDITLSAC